MTEARTVTLRAALVVVAALCVAGPALAAPPPSTLPPTVQSWLKPIEQTRGPACCKRCSKGIPCGNTCISAKKRCKQPPGCAC